MGFFFFQHVQMVTRYRALEKSTLVLRGVVNYLFDPIVTLQLSVDNKSAAGQLNQKNGQANEMEMRSYMENPRKKIV